MTSPAGEVIHGKGFDAEVIRTNRRKTATLKIVEGKVSVVVPRSTSKDKVEALVNQKTRWIREKLLLQKEHQPPKLKEYVSGECFTYLGRNYRLKVESGPEKSVKLKNGRLMVQVPPSVQNRDRYVQSVLTDWYRAHALETLRERVEHRFSCYQMANMRLGRGACSPLIKPIIQVT